MFRGDWRKRLTPKLIAWSVVCLLALLVGFGAIFYGVSEQIKNDRHSYERKSEYAKDTYRPAHVACLAQAAENQSNCIARVNDEYRKNERDQDDLAAQQTTAVWTFLMGCASIIGMMLSAVGVILVWTTFHQTRRSASAAVDAINHAKDLSRAWLTIDAEPTRVISRPNSFNFFYTISIKNVGATVASNVIVQHTIINHHPKIERDIAKWLAKWERDRKASPSALAAGEQIVSKVSCSQPKHVFSQIGIDNPDRIHPVILIYAMYSTQNSDERRCARRTFQVSQTCKDITGYSADRPPFDYFIALRRLPMSADELHLESLVGAAA
jgi:hypothetical protein